MSFLNELKRRNVIRVAAAYVVTAWLVIQVVETIFPAFGFGDAAIRYATIAFAIGLIPALVVAWVFELTPEGIKKDGEIDHGAPPSLRNAKRLDRMILVVLAVALGYFAFDKFILAPQQMEEEIAEARQEGRSEALVESYGDRSIAVLPFTDMSPNGDQEYFSDGIAEELSNLLTRVPELRVISRSSAFSFKGKDIDMATIGDQLNVAHVLEGSVRKAGDRILITAQLIETRTDTSETIDPEAYALFLEGKFLMNERLGVEVNDQAITLLKQAIDIEPLYADAWTVLGLAYTFAFSNEENQTEERSVELGRLFKEALANALIADPDHPAANAYLAWASMQEFGDYLRPGPQFERALELDPYNWEVIRGSILYAVVIGRSDVAAALGRIAASRNPLCGPCHWAISRQLFIAGDYESAEKSLRKVLSQRSGRGLHRLGMILLLKGDTDEARAIFEQLPVGAEREHGHLFLALTTGETEGIEQKINEFGTKWGEEFIRYKAELYALSGNFDMAFETLDVFLGAQIKSNSALALRNPLFRNLEGDPRWDAWLERAGIAPHQLADIQFNPRLPAFNGSLQ
jgi:TolB-like protein